MVVNKKYTIAKKETKKYEKSKLTPKTSPYKPLTVSIKRAHGRNAVGRVTVRKRKGTKKFYRIIQFNRSAKDFLELEGIVKTVEKDPNRSSFIALVEFVIDEKPRFVYMLATENMKPGLKVKASEQMVDIEEGNATRLVNIPVGTMVHNIDGKYIKSAGSFGTIISKIDDKAFVKMPSKRRIAFDVYSFATVGQLSNLKHENKVYYKAGQSFHRGIRPKVRGVAMNPVDHPHGGGEGRTGTKRAPVNRTGRHVKGKKTSRSRREMLK